MDLFNAVINSGQFVNQSFNNYNSMTKDEKLRQQLYRCTYNDDIKFIVEKAVRQVLNVYPHFNSQILQFYQNKAPSRYLEIKGILEIQIKGKTCKVDYNMMIPNNFPRKPPLVRIINRNPEYIVDPHYKDLQSQTDPKSYILSKRLQTVKNWNPNSSLVEIIIESSKMMRQNFPFYKSKSSHQSNINPGWSNLNQSKTGGGWSNSTSQAYSNNQNFNYNPNFTNQGYTNPTYNQGFSSQGFNNQGYNMGNVEIFVNPQPPIPFKPGINIHQVIENSNKFVSESKKIIQKLKTQHIKSVQKIQNLQTIKTSLGSESEYLRNQNNRMSQFLKKNQKSDFSNITNLIQVKDQKSQQILDFTSSIKAREDCIALLEERFNNGDINFEEFIKVVKKLEEQKFEDKLLLKKCIES